MALTDAQEKVFFRKIEELVLKAEREYQSTKRKGGRAKSRGKKGSRSRDGHETGDACFLGIKMGLREARLAYRGAQLTKPTPEGGT